MIRHSDTFWKGGPLPSLLTTSHWRLFSKVKLIVLPVKPDNSLPLQNLPRTSNMLNANSTWWQMLCLESTHFGLLALRMFWAIRFQHPRQREKKTDEIASYWTADTGLALKVINIGAPLRHFHERSKASATYLLDSIRSTNSHTRALELHKRQSPNALCGMA